MMERSSAIRIIQNTFEKPFDKEQYRRFIKELFNHLDESNSFFWAGNRIPNAGAFQPFINSIERVGKYQDADGKKIDCLIVNLKKETALEHARTRQRNFVARYLQGHMGGDDKDAALVAFVSPDSEDWRFSLVKVDYSLDLGKLKTELTPARRYSFLVGENESSHTAQLQLLPILQEDRRDPLLTDFEEAFSIEIVTKEFFTKYRELYHDVEEALRDVIKKDAKVRDNFQANKVDTVNFAKKLLGQIVFLYFLQKKGWFGVPRDGEWGQGSKNFLRELFEKKHGDYRNFFNDILELLFYDALRRDRSEDDHYYPHFNCKIPFLNGGLFDPMNDYNWVDTEILLPNELFSNKNKTKEGDTGTGILDVFDRYNFTVKEDEPLDKEVAVDPEMLGKVFENLLEIKDRKSKGTYYTPREIVHYMCQESLINYLDTTINSGTVPLVKENPVNLKLLGAPATQQIAMKTDGYTGRVPREDIETFVRMGEMAVEHDARVESTGKETKDYAYKLPAGIRLNAALIDNALADIRVCDPAIGSGAFPVGMMTEVVRARNTLTTYLSGKEDRTNYHFKRHAIQSCLYGVDIDPSAVEIAKLRLWLSLVVDEEDIKQIQPLPNLDYKIVSGNSLLGVERNMFNNELFQKLEALKPLYFDETNAKKKMALRKHIDNLISNITKDSETFDFEVYFSEVFHEKNGFDVVIANPPYGIIYDQELKNILETDYTAFCRNNDIYIAFYEKGVRLLTANGTLVFISSNTFLNGDYFKQFRKLLTGKVKINEIIDHKNFLVFDDPTVFVCTLSCTRIATLLFPYTFVLKEVNNEDSGYYLGMVTVTDPSEKPFKPESPIMTKIFKRKDADILDNLFFVKDVGFNYWTKGRGKTRGNSIGSKILYQGKKLNDKDIAFLKGRDIEKYHCRIPSNYLRHDYAKLLDESVDTFRFSKEFLELTPKIIYRQTAHKIIATIDTRGFYLDKTVHLIVPRAKGNSIDLRFLLSLLNSRLFEYLYAYISQEGEGRAFAQVKTTYIKQLPIVITTLENQNKHIQVVDQILAMTQHTDYLSDIAKQAYVKRLQCQIDKMTYELYGLAPDEIALVEGNSCDDIMEVN